MPAGYRGFELRNALRGTGFDHGQSCAAVCETCKILLLLQSVTLCNQLN